MKRQKGVTMNQKIYNELATLALEAADTLWAVEADKPTDRRPKSITRDIYLLLQKYGYPPLTEEKKIVKYNIEAN